MSNNSIVFEQSIDKNDKLLSKINEFVSMFKPLEINSLNILQDNLTQAIFCECHVRAKELVSLGTTDVPLDTERQSDYKANRDVVEDSIAYNQMKEDAKNKRTFSNIVAEYNDSFDGSFPLKIIGGQHRFNAISEAFKNSKINELHGVKVYFNLNMDQRLDVQLISNTNIVVSSDLLDRMFETVKGPELRDWCQKVGLLDKGKDFADKKQRGNNITVRGARTFIMNYYNGRDVPDDKFEKTKTIPVIAKTGGLDNDWEELKASKKEFPASSCKVSAAQRNNRL